MRVRTLVAVVLLILVTVFFVVNWRVFAAPAKISLLVTTVEMPIGVVSLTLGAVALLVLLGYAGFWQSTLLMEFRRQSRDLQAQRALAESAEASRFTALATLVREEIANSDSRLEAALGLLRQEIKESENSLAASIAEMDDRIAREGPRRVPG